MNADTRQILLIGGIPLACPSPGPFIFLGSPDFRTSNSHHNFTASYQCNYRGFADKIVLLLYIASYRNHRICSLQRD